MVSNFQSTNFFRLALCGQLLFLSTSIRPHVIGLAAHPFVMQVVSLKEFGMGGPNWAEMGLELPPKIRACGHIIIHNHPMALLIRYDKDTGA